MALSASLKARLKKLYYDGATPYAKLVVLSGLHRFEFQQLVKVEGWGPRPRSAPKPKTTSKPKPKPKPKTKTKSNAAAAAAKAKTDTETGSDADTDAKVAPAKPKRKPPAVAISEASAIKQPAAKSVTTKIALLQKIYQTLWAELEKLHAQIGAKSQDRERASRALSQLVTTMEKAVNMQSAIKRDAKSKEKPKDREALAHADDMRRKIAERLERLHRERLAQK